MRDTVPDWQGGVAGGVFDRQGGLRDEYGAKTIASYPNLYHFDGEKRTYVMKPPEELLSAALNNPYSRLDRKLLNSILENLSGEGEKLDKLTGIDLRSFYIN